MKTLGQMTPRFAMLGTFLALLTGPAMSGAEPVCSQATLQGTYMVLGTGILGAGTTGGATFATLGRVTYDGVGAGKVTSTSSLGGAISRDPGTPVTYTVNANCTGTKSAGGTTFDFVITADGRELLYIVTNAGTVVSGRAIRLDNSRN